MPLHDAVALLEAIVPGTLRPSPIPLQVACDLGPARGATVPDSSDSLSVTVTTALAMSLSPCTSKGTSSES